MHRFNALVFIFLSALFACRQAETGGAQLPPQGETELAFPAGEEEGFELDLELGSADDGEEEAEWSFTQKRDGRLLGGPRMMDVYERARLDTILLPFIGGDILDALENNLRLLEIQGAARNQQVGDLRISQEDLRETIRILRAWQMTYPMGIHDHLEAYQIWGGDRRGNVRFTGYFTPVLEVARQPQGRFQYPLYKRPLDWEGELPTRAEIEGAGVLKGQGLELAYATDKVDIYYMQVQGSGFVEYPDGSRELFAYNGTNRHPYRSIEKFIMSRDDIPLENLSMGGIRRYLKQNHHLLDTVLFYNPSYTFFIPRRGEPKGAGGVPLIGQHSIAVDRRYIPLGSCLVASFPIFDHAAQRVVGYDYRYFVAQDVGGAIRGPGRVDVYTGVGPQAARQAGRINNYGRLWLLLPKQTKAVFISN
jgi:membrane-bound lytic murein transglycosylase A